MWVVVYMAQSKTMADRIQNMLVAEGFLTKIRPVYKNVAVEDNYYEIMVPKSEAPEAHQTLIQNGYGI
jgi:hypothetical protein